MTLWDRAREELFIQYPPDYAEQFNTGPARVPDLEKGHTCHVERNGERIEVIIERRKDPSSPEFSP
jgi:hypothetical protein